MQFCDNGTAWIHVWINNGINRCFYDSFTSGLLCVFIFLCGILQCFIYGRYSITVDKKRIPTSRAIYAQVVITLSLATEAITHMILQNVELYDKVLCGYHVSTACSFILAYLITLRLLFLERNYALPSIPTRGHGLLLILFWTLALIREILAFVSWWSSEWWWHLKSWVEKSVFLNFFLKKGPNGCAYEYELLRILLNMTLLPMHTDVQTSHRGMSIDK